ncbi:sugar phosphate isomerase/epimerase family protein [Paenibacillus aestuarii]|uniref:Sugar phosphate isomerase/epimerase n=1 Tax=Paenibacillus aestuarii TaxID=516965 RepID=A0ABW0KAL3_9BACL|nr:sugar phosphate isomerase/epimerase [Paenibacillus aestuarii]
MSLELGLQLYSVRESLRQNPIDTLQRIAEIGYKNLELALQNKDANIQAAGMSAADFRREIEGLGMKTVSCHARVNEDDMDRLLDFLQEIGSPTVVIPMALLNGRQHALDYCRTLNKYGEAARKRDISLYYHNHFQEFQEFEGEKIMDTLINNTDPELVKFELDTYWTVRGGEDPIHWIRKLGNRCDLFHQKDLPNSVEQVNFFEVFGTDAPITMDMMYQTQIPAQFTESGEGVLDIASYVKEIRSLNQAKYIFIEQDMTSRGELESIAISYRNMTELLKG